MLTSLFCGCCDFYPRSPCGERLDYYAIRCQRDYISIHALLAESDILAVWLGCKSSLFLSTLSLRRATLRHSADCNCQNISIHALLAESDHQAFFYTAQHTYFYPRSPCGERPLGQHLAYLRHQFLSTLSLRRATTIHIHTCQYFFNFYPRSPCGERPTALA